MKHEQKRVVVTGGAGFLGSHLCARLLEKGHLVVAIDNLYTGNRDNIVSLKNNSRFTFIEHNVINFIDPAIYFEPRVGIDIIFNFACPASPYHYQKDPIFTTKTSLFGILNMLELAKKYNARIVQASTSEVYGDPLQHPQIEEYWGNVNPIGIRSCYDEGKRCAESLMFDYYRMYAVDIKIVRIFNTYGPHMDPNDGRVVSNFIMQALRGEALTIYGDGKQTRSFCYVDDLIDGILAMAEADRIVTGPINLGNPIEYTLLDLITVLERVMHKSLNIIKLPLPQDDPVKRKPDISKAIALLQWDPKISLEDGIVRTVAYFKSI